MAIFALGVALLGAALGLFLTPLARRLARRVGFLDRPGPRKIHTAPIAYGGGLAVIAAALLALVAGGWCWRQLLLDPAWLAWRDALGIGAFAREVNLAAQPPMLRSLLVCLAGALAMAAWGLLDDLRPMTVAVKLAGQFAVAIAVVAAGVRLTMLIGDNLATQAVTVLWLVLIANSFNLLDNMDGLCAGAAAIAAGFLACFAAATGQSAVALALAALAGACLGFLRYNLAPASIFLGDTGSLFIGFLLGSLSVVTTYFHYRESALSLAVPLLILAIPLYDTASVLTIRLLEGRSLLRGDTSHFSHRLVALGLSRRQAVATIHLAGLALGLPALILPRLPLAPGLMLAAQAVLILALIAVLEYAGHRKQKPSDA